MTVMYQDSENGEWQIYHCALSGRIEFDPTMAWHKARWLVRQRKAILAVAIQDGVIFAQFVWNAGAMECQQTEGPEL